jgi:hypothetical protein
MRLNDDPILSFVRSFNSQFVMFYVFYKNAKKEFNFTPSKRTVVGASGTSRVLSESASLNIIRCKTGIYL